MRQPIFFPPITGHIPTTYKKKSKIECSELEISDVKNYPFFSLNFCGKYYKYPLFPLFSHINKKKLTNLMHPFSETVTPYK